MIFEARYALHKTTWITFAAMGIITGCGQNPHVVKDVPKTDSNSGSTTAQTNSNQNTPPPAGGGPTPPPSGGGPVPSGPVGPGEKVPCISPCKPGTPDIIAKPIRGAYYGERPPIVIPDDMTPIGPARPNYHLENGPGIPARPTGETERRPCLPNFPCSVIGFKLPTDADFVDFGDEDWTYEYAKPGVNNVRVYFIKRKNPKTGKCVWVEISRDRLAIDGQDGKSIHFLVLGHTPSKKDGIEGDIAFYKNTGTGEQKLYKKNSSGEWDVVVDLTLQKFVADTRPLDQAAKDLNEYDFYIYRGILHQKVGGRLEPIQNLIGPEGPAGRSIHFLVLDHKPGTADGNEDDVAFYRAPSGEQKLYKKNKNGSWTTVANLTVQKFVTGDKTPEQVMKDLNDLDFYFFDGYLYQKRGNEMKIVQDLIGPQGPQGETGPAGHSVNFLVLDHKPGKGDGSEGDIAFYRAPDGEQKLYKKDDQGNWNPFANLTLQKFVTGPKEPKDVYAELNDLDFYIYKGMLYRKIGPEMAPIQNLIGPQGPAGKSTHFIVLDHTPGPKDGEENDIAFYKNKTTGEQKLYSKNVSGTWDIVADLTLQQIVAGDKPLAEVVHDLRELDFYILDGVLYQKVDDQMKIVKNLVGPPGADGHNPDILPLDHEPTLADKTVNGNLAIADDKTKHTKKIFKMVGGEWKPVMDLTTTSFTVSQNPPPKDTQATPGSGWLYKGVVYERDANSWLPVLDLNPKKGPAADPMVAIPPTPARALMETLRKKLPLPYLSKGEAGSNPANPHTIAHLNFPAANMSTTAKAGGPAAPFVKDATVTLQFSPLLPPEDTVDKSKPVQIIFHMSVRKLSYDKTLISKVNGLELRRNTEIFCLLQQKLCSGVPYRLETWKLAFNPAFGVVSATPNSTFSTKFDKWINPMPSTDPRLFYDTVNLTINFEDLFPNTSVWDVLYNRAYTAPDPVYTDYVRSNIPFVIADDIWVREGTTMEIQHLTLKKAN